MDEETKITIMWEDIPQLEVRIQIPKISSRLLVDKPILVVPKIIYPDRITFQTFDEFLCLRLPSKYRADIDDIVKRYGLREFNPYAMCKKSHGRNMTDFLWMKFDDEEVSFNDIRLR